MSSRTEFVSSRLDSSFKKGVNGRWVGPCLYLYTDSSIILCPDSSLIEILRLKMSKKETNKSKT